MALIRPCEVVATKILRDSSFTLMSTDNTFKGQIVIGIEDILSIAARVQDRGRSYFVEQPGSLDFFENTLHIEDIVQD